MTVTRGGHIAAVCFKLRSLPDLYFATHRQIFAALCIQHDRLCGISAVLSTSGQYAGVGGSGDIRMSLLPLEVPRFNLPSTADPNEFLPTMVYRGGENTMEQSTADWTAARSRLLEDPDADLSDLIGPQP